MLDPRCSCMKNKISKFSKLNCLIFKDCKFQLNYCDLTMKDCITLLSVFLLLVLMADQHKRSIKISVKKIEFELKISESKIINAIEWLLINNMIFKYESVGNYQTYFINDCYLPEIDKKNFSEKNIFIYGDSLVELKKMRKDRYIRSFFIIKKDRYFE